MRLRNSFWAMLGREQSETPEVVLERVREALLDILEPLHLKSAARIENAVVFARDLDALWYLRPEIMNAIASTHGEAVARQCLELITAKFQGHHPGAVVRRPGGR